VWVKKGEKVSLTNNLTTKEVCTFALRNAIRSPDDTKGFSTIKGAFCRYTGVKQPFKNFFFVQVLKNIQENLLRRL